MKEKVLVGMSGGVDSSVTAYLLKEAGYEVEGISFILFETRGRKSPRSCCSLEAIQDAALSAAMVGVRHTALELRSEFIEKVIDPFVNGYLQGITPNPCVLCNLHIKFPYLLREADKRGASYIATGHYARVEKAEDRGFVLLKGLDSSKDQSYFLYVLNQTVLSRLVLPLGTYRKEHVREIARRLNLPSAKRPESVEICFVDNGDYACFIKNLLPEAEKPGPIIGPDGSVLGTHKGIFNYTIGQRRGLNIHYKEPLYVLKIDARTNTITVGTKTMAMKTEVVVEDINWIQGFPPTKEGHPIRVTAKIRSMMRDEPAELQIQKGGREVKIIFDEPQWAPAPGQAAVFYQDEELLGGGTIKNDT